MVQDPKDAIHSSMPESAIANVDVDHVVSADDIGPLLVNLTGRTKEKKKVRN